MLCLIKLKKTLFVLVKTVVAIKSSNTAAFFVLDRLIVELSWCDAASNF